MEGLTLETLQVIIKAQTAPLQKAVSDVNKDMTNLSTNVQKQTSKISNAFSNMKSFISRLAIGAAIAKIGKDSIEVASDIQEVQNVVDTAFGDMAYKCEAFARTAKDQFGLSELSAKRTASTFMAMGKGMGMLEEDSSNMAIRLAQMSGDVASFYNMSQEEAANKLKSVYTGETETLKELGIVMTQTNLQNFALKEGITQSMDSMNQAQLTALRYKFVMEQLSLANGDFAKTSGSWANQVRILQETWRQLLGIVGSGLIAVFTPVIQVLNAVLNKIVQFAQIVSAVLSGLFGKKSGGGGAKETAKSLNDIGTSLQDASGGASGLNNQLDKTSGKANKAAKAMGQLASMDEINNLSKSNGDSGSSGGSGGSGGGAGVGGVGDLGIGALDLGLDQEIDTSGVDKAVAKVKKAMESLKDFLEDNKAKILAIMAGLGASIGAYLVIKNSAAITGAFTTILTTVVNFFKVVAVGPAGWQALLTSLTGISAPALAVVAAIGVIVGALVYLYQTSDTFRAAVGEALNNLMAILQNFWDTILVPLFAFLADIFVTVLVPLGEFIATVVVKAIETVATILLSLWNDILAPFVNFLIDIVGIALQGIIDIWNAWKPAIETVATVIDWIWNQVLAPFIDWLTNQVTTWIGELGKDLQGFLDGIKEMFQGLVDFFVGVFTLDIDKAWSGIRKIFEGFDKFLKNVFSTDWTKYIGKLGEPLNIACRTISGIWESIKKVFSGIIQFVKGVFTGDWRSAWNGVKSIFSGVFNGFVAIAKAPINGVIACFNGILNGINWVIDGINSIGVDIPDWLGGGRIGFDIPKLPNVPYLAKGGVINKPTPAIFGEAGAEAVVPLENNTGWITKIAHQLNSKLGGDATNDITDMLEVIIDILNDFDPNPELVLELDGEKVSKKLDQIDKRRQRRRGK